MHVEVINTGTELLLGHVLNTHLRFLAEALFPLGLRIGRQVTVPDGLVIREALVEAAARAEILLVTGGLGPTTDDITRDVVADWLGLRLVHDEEIMRAITERFARRGLALSARIGLQALRPPEATVLPNEHGTAPGLYLPPTARSPHLFLLPGPPRELHPMFTASVLPILQKVLPPRPELAMRNYRTAGLGESAVEELVGAPLLALGLEVGYCARPGEVDLRLIGSAEALARAEKIVGAQLGAQLVSRDQSSLEKVIVDRLSARGETLATAESCTGGLLAHRVTNVPGASAVFLEGFVTYANEAKTRALGVDAALLRAHGAVSREVAAAMAEGARTAAGVDHALATTGIAGPGGGSDAKPLGTVFIALATKLGPTTVEQHRFPTDRETFKDLTAQTALDLLRRRLG
ncbi:MAG: competence/damage-inducible protein A [Verrucomicrobia bacterium]|nr:MAG: competence/damage-inducible protein A [Verrucomicrobiota bacterium]